MSNTPPMTKDELTQAVAAIPHWFHSLDLDYGIVTPGDKSQEILQEQLTALNLPDLQGKTVLDIGAWDGFFSWTAERLGASRIVSLDHFVWSLNRAKAMELQSDWHKNGTDPMPLEDTAAWEPDTLPGKRGYDLAHKALNSQAEFHIGDFLDVSIEEIDGPFDVVFYLGVLYHMRNPMLSLEKVAAATKGVAIIETAAIVPNYFTDRSLCEFFERDELADDFTNWWVPTEQALIGMCRAAGFRRVEVVQKAPEIIQPVTLPEAKTFLQKVKRAGGHVLREFDLLPQIPGPLEPHIRHYRAIVHAWK